MVPPLNTQPASAGQIKKLVSLGHDLSEIQNVTTSEAGVLIHAGKVGMIGPAPYAWKKNPASAGR